MRLKELSGNALKVIAIVAILDDGHHLALRRRLLHIPQSHLRHGPPGLLARCFQ